MQDDSSLNKHFQSTFKAMGGAGEIQLYCKSKERADSIRDLVIQEALRIEEKFSRYRTESILSKINASAGAEAVQVDEETAALLDYADTAFVQSDGLFDITSGVLRRAWDFKSSALPTKSALGELTSLVGWNKVEWRRPFIRLPKKGMEIDFGGIGKEYAVDRACGICLENGIRSGLINLAGDLRVLGPHGVRPWYVGIAHPRIAGEVLACVALSFGALATSGDYERFIEVDGERYCHILNPKTGWSVQDLQSVTVHAESCLVAGTATTIAMLYGEKKAQKFLSDLGLPFVVVRSNGEILSGPKGFLVKEKPEVSQFIK